MIPALRPLIRLTGGTRLPDGSKSAACRSRHPDPNYGGEFRLAGGKTPSPVDPPPANNAATRAENTKC
jgi:hypothetical protein